MEQSSGDVTAGGKRRLWLFEDRLLDRGFM
jgi:hypothetical protein